MFSKCYRNLYGTVSGIVSPAVYSPYANFKSLQLSISLEIVVLTVNEHENISIAGLNRRAGYATWYSRRSEQNGVLSS